MEVIKKIMQLLPSIKNNNSHRKCNQVSIAKSTITRFNASKNKCRNSSKPLVCVLFKKENASKLT